MKLSVFNKIIIVGLFMLTSFNCLSAQGEEDSQKLAQTQVAQTLASWLPEGWKMRSEGELVQNGDLIFVQQGASFPSANGPGTQFGDPLPVRSFIVDNIDDQGIRCMLFDAPSGLQGKRIPLFVKGGSIQKVGEEPAVFAIQRGNKGGYGKNMLTSGSLVNFVYLSKPDEFLTKALGDQKVSGVTDFVRYNMGYLSRFGLFLAVTNSGLMLSKRTRDNFGALRGNILGVAHGAVSANVKVNANIVTFDQGPSLPFTGKIEQVKNMKQTKEDEQKKNKFAGRRREKRKRRAARGWKRKNAEAEGIEE